MIHLIRFASQAAQSLPVRRKKVKTTKAKQNASLSSQVRANSAGAAQRPNRPP